MRTTLVIPDPILLRAKKLAEKKKETLSAFVSEALELEILRTSDAQRETRKARTIRAFRMGSPLVDVNDREAIYRTMDKI